MCGLTKLLNILLLNENIKTSSQLGREGPKKGKKSVSWYVNGPYLFYLYEGYLFKTLNNEINLSHLKRDPYSRSVPKFAVMGDFN